MESNFIDLDNHLSNFRDKNGTLLSYQSYELNHEIVENSYELIKNYESIKQANKIFKETFVKFYFSKIIFKELKHLTDEYILFDYLKDKKIFKNKYKSFLPKNLIFKIFSENPIFDIKNININNQSLIVKNKNTLRAYIKSLLNNFSFFSKKHYPIKNNTIAIKYDEGLDLNKRNDIYWLSNSNIPFENIIIYFENKYQYDDFKKNFNKSYIGINQIKIIKVWEYKYIFKKKIFKLKFNKPVDNIEEWLIIELKKILNEVNFWYNFFQYFNVKIHSDPNEYEESPIYKHIALDKLNSITFGRLRSYPNWCKGYFHYYYLNDIFFVWGNDSLKRLKNHKNLINYFISSGYTYGSPSEEKKIDLNKIKNNFKKNNVDKIILVVDSNIVSNFYSQGIRKNDYNNFYKIISNLLNNPKIGLIIKPKNPKEYFNDSPASSLFLDKKNCYIVSDKQEKSSDYATISDYVIGIQPQISSAFLESLLVCKKGVFFDYAKLTKYEKDFYNLNENIFLNSFKQLEIHIDEIVNNYTNILNSSHNKTLKDILNEIDNFRDLNGPKRISHFLNNLYINFNSFKKEDLIKKTIIDYNLNFK